MQNHSFAIGWLKGVGEAFGTSEISLHAVEIFLRVARSDIAGAPLTSKEIAKITGLSTSAISRNIAYLGDWNRNKTPGLGLVEAKPQPFDRRSKPVRLTAKGRLMANLIGHLSLTAASDSAGLGDRAVRSISEHANADLPRLRGDPTRRMA